jgi:putative glutamine amidotransferase
MIDPENQKITIGVVLSSQGFSEGSLGINVRREYLQSLTEAGAEYELIEPYLSEVQLDQKFAGIHGLLLTGGSDVDPQLYGEPEHEKLGQTDRLRDAAELYLINKACSHNLPVLGICRGMQFINVALGGTLYQDLPSEFESDVLHRADGERRFETLQHAIRIYEGSRLQSLLDASELPVNSVHHQGIKKLAEPLAASAQSIEDGLIEAIEHKSHPFMIGVQCHPESLADNIRPVWRKLFKAFIDSCRMLQTK